MGLHASSTKLGQQNTVDNIVHEVFNHLNEFIVKYPGKAKSFENIWKALEIIRKAGGNNYSIASVGKLTKDFGGPQPQSIRNSSGEEFRHLITMYAKAVDKPGEADPKDPHGHLLKEVTELHTKQHIRLLIHENKSLRNQLNLFKKTFAKTAIPIPPTLGSGPVSSGPHPILTEDKIEAIRGFLDGLKKKGYDVNEFGAIIDIDGLELAAPGFVDALQSIITHWSEMHCTGGKS